MNKRFFRLVIIMGASLFCASAFAQTWTRLGTSTPYTIYPAGTSTSYEYRAVIGLSSAPTNATQLYVYSQKTTTIPFVVNAISGSTTDIVRFQANGTSKFVINSSGNVGIGTTAPGTYKLAVEGKIGAREVVVTAYAWADHVLKKEYSLKPLNEVEKFITKNNHLEGIPSEKEVKTNGVAVGEMQVKLLTKVEEMTLYMIQMEKNMVKMQKKMNSMQKIIDEFQKNRNKN